MHALNPALFSTFALQAQASAAENPTEMRVTDGEVRLAFKSTGETVSNADFITYGLVEQAQQERTLLAFEEHLQLHYGLASEVSELVMNEALGRMDDDGSVSSLPAWWEKLAREYYRASLFAWEILQLRDGKS